MFHRVGVGGRRGVPRAVRLPQPVVPAGGALREQRARELALRPLRLREGGSGGARSGDPRHEALNGHRGHRRSRPGKNSATICRDSLFSTCEGDAEARDSKVLHTSR